MLITNSKATKTSSYSQKQVLQPQEKKEQVCNASSKNQTN
mgnify:CR=1 FL=1